MPSSNLIECCLRQSSVSFSSSEKAAVTVRVFVIRCLVPNTSYFSLFPTSDWQWNPSHPLDSTVLTIDSLLGVLSVILSDDCDD